MGSGLYVVCSTTYVDVSRNAVHLGTVTCGLRMQLAFRIGWQPLVHTVAASGTYGCSLRHMGLRPIPCRALVQRTAHSIC